jgi:histidinol-phosphatase (PHP family)
MNINYHVHTPLCNHATGSMPDYIRHAIRQGLKEICFLDHLTLNPADKGLTMIPEEVALYYHAARFLAHQYREAIRVKIGLEVDFHPDFIEVINYLTHSFDFDVIGGSVHYLGQEDIVTRKSDWGRGEGDPDLIFASYFKWMNRMLDHDFFDVVCHFDLPKKFCRLPQESFEGTIDELLVRIKDKGLALEVNTSGYEHPIKEAYPSVNILKRCFELGIPVTLGSDAHRPDQLITHYDKAATLLAAAGYSHLSTFSRRRRGRIPINGNT